MTKFGEVEHNPQEAAQGKVILTQLKSEWIAEGSVTKPRTVHFIATIDHTSAKRHIITNEARLEYLRKPIHCDLLFTERAWQNPVLVCLLWHQGTCMQAIIDCIC